MMNALSLAEIVSGGSEVVVALQRWEAQERSLTNHTQAHAAELARTHAVGSGMQWDDVGLRAALHVPIGTRPEEFVRLHPTQYYSRSSSSW
jgi:hypothetical protein